MDYERRKIAELHRRIGNLYRTEVNVLIRTTWGKLPESEAREKLEKLKSEREACYKLVDQWESRYLLKRAENYGIEVPQRSEWRNVELIEDTDAKVTRVQAWLNEEGKAMISKQIRDARFAEWKRRADLLVPILALLVAALALFKDMIVELLKTRF